MIAYHAMEHGSHVPCVEHGVCSAMPRAQITHFFHIKTYSHGMGMAISIHASGMLDGHEHGYGVKSRVKALQDHTSFMVRTCIFMGGMLIFSRLTPLIQKGSGASDNLHRPSALKLYGRICSSSSPTGQALPVVGDLW